MARIGRAFPSRPFTGHVTPPAVIIPPVINDIVFSAGPPVATTWLTYLPPVEAWQALSPLIAWSAESPE